jgi:predicted TIM-barrel fold metal-dependent hydrolase
MSRFIGPRMIWASDFPHSDARAGLLGRTALELYGIAAP